MQAVVCIERPKLAAMGAYVCIYGHICAYMGYMCVHMGHMCVHVCLQPATEKPLNQATCWPCTAFPLSQMCQNPFFSAFRTSEIGGRGYSHGYLWPHVRQNCNPGH